MSEDAKDFMRALESHVRDILAAGTVPAEYNNEAIEIVDARNHYFRNAGMRPTDESANIYALRDLCRIGADPLSCDPDLGRIAAITRNFF